MPDTFSIKPHRLLAEGFMESCLRFHTHNGLHINGQAYTYDQLLEKAEIIFAQLSQEKIPAYIGIYTGESVWTYAALIAVSLSGACYVPLNSKFPAAKLQAITKACGLELIISEKTISFSESANTLIIDINSKIRKKCTPLLEQETAYLLFTSGTTGEPKGVPVSKNNVAAFFEYCKNNYDFNANDRFLQPYELSFDVSVFSVFAAWNAGACVYCVPEEGFKHFNTMSTIKDHSITVSSMVPTVLLYLDKYLDGLSFPSLRYSFFSGDKLYQHLAVKWQRAAANAVIYNCYGPTETTIVCTAYRWDEKIAGEESVNNIVPLGKAFDNMCYLLLDENNRALTGDVGELCFSGAQVIDAYLDHKDEGRFFTHDDQRYYKTGDLAAVNAKGNLIFHGRTDSQLKINGFRVEPGEIEQAIFKITQKNTVVISIPEDNVNVLTAFIESDTMSVATLKEKLGELLPPYMVPVHYKFMAAFPINMNGKTDLQQLKTMA